MDGEEVQLDTFHLSISSVSQGLSSLLWVEGMLELELTLLEYHGMVVLRGCAALLGDKATPWVTPAP